MFFRRCVLKKQKGFTLVEVLAATIVFSLGSVYLGEAFFVSLDTYTYCEDYLKVLSWADDKVWETQETINYFGPLAIMESSGRLPLHRKPVNWQISVGPADETGSIYQINLILSWKEGLRTVRLKRSAYTLYEKK